MAAESDMVPFVKASAYLRPCQAANSSWKARVMSVPENLLRLITSRQFCSSSSVMIGQWKSSSGSD